MTWTITYYNDSVQEEIIAMPAGFLGRYLRYADRMEVHGPDLGMPHTRSMGEGLFELRLKSAKRDCSGFLLYNGWQKNRDVTPIYQENRQDPAKRT